MDAKTKECTRKTEEKLDGSYKEGHDERNLIEDQWEDRSLDCSKNGRRKIIQNSIEVDAETKECTRKTEEKLDGIYKEGHERKKPK